MARGKSGEEAFCGSLGLVWRVHQLCVLVSGLASGKWNIWQMDKRSKEMGKLGVRRRTGAWLRPPFGLSRTSRRRWESYRATSRDEE